MFKRRRCDTVPAEKITDTGLHLTFDIPTSLHLTTQRTSFWNEVKNKEYKSILEKQDFGYFELKIISFLQLKSQLASE
jgi:hypothetical protein